MKQPQSQILFPRAIQVDNKVCMKEQTSRDNQEIQKRGAISLMSSDIKAWYKLYISKLTWY
jgi:hypothetical protein